MKKQSGFALLVVMAMMTPLMLALHSVWRQASVNLELIHERQKFYQEMSILEASTDRIIKLLFKQGTLLWSAQKLDHESLILHAELQELQKQSQNSVDNYKLRACCDRPDLFSSNQLRLTVYLEHDKKVKRHLSCMLEQRWRVNENGNKQKTMVVSRYTVGTGL